MAGIDDYLQEALKGYTPTNLKKEEAVADTSTRKKQGTLDSLRSFNSLDFATSNRTGRGQATQSRLDNDLRYMPEIDLKQQYGEDITAALLAERDTGSRQYDDLQRTSRSMPRGVADTAIGLGLGVSNSVGGLVSAGAGLVDRDAGIGAANVTQAISEFGSSYQSDALKDKKALYESKSKMAARDNKYLAESGAFGDTYFMESADRILRDASTAIYETAQDPSLIADVTAQGIGSLAGGSVAGKAVSSGVKGVVGITAAKTAAAQSGKVEDILAVAGKAKKAEIATMTGVIAGMEAGGAYNDTVNKIMDMQHEQLMQTSPFYKKQMDMHGDQDKAKRETAHAAGQKALLTVAPLAALAGRAVAKFELNPASSAMGATYKGAASNTALQTLEEGFQGLLSSKASNVAIKDYADEQLDTDAGVGRALGEGALAGTTMSATIHAPAVSYNMAADTVKGVVNQVSKRLNGILDANEKSSPVSKENLATASADIAGTTDAINTVFNSVADGAPVEQQEATRTYTDSLMNLATHVDGSYSSERVNTITMDSKNKFEAIDKLAQVAGDSQADPQTRMEAGLALLQTEQEAIDAANYKPELFEAMDDNDPAAQMVNAITGAVGATFKNPEVVRVVQAVKAMMAEAQQTQTVTEDSVNTPQGMEAINTAIQVAESAPEFGNLENNQAILAHDKSGKIQLTPNQRKAVEISVALMQAEKSRDTSRSTIGENALSVGKEITLEGGDTGPSIAQHARGILTSIRNNDTEMATDQLTQLGNFAEHMSNKVTALDVSASKPGAPKESYQAWSNNTQSWFEAEKTIFFNNKSQKSVDMANTILHEAGLAVAAYNNLIDATGLEGFNKLPEVTTAPAVKDAPLPSVADMNQAMRDARVDEDMSDQQAYAEMEADAARQESIKNIPTPPPATTLENTIQDLDGSKPVTKTSPKKKGVHEYTKEEEAARIESKKPKKTATKDTVEKDEAGTITLSGKGKVKHSYKVTEKDGKYIVARQNKNGTTMPIKEGGAAHKKVVKAYLDKQTPVVVKEEIEKKTVEIKQLKEALEDVETSLEESNNQRQIDKAEQQAREEDEYAAQQEQEKSETIAEPIIEEEAAVVEEQVVPEAEAVPVVTPKVTGIAALFPYLMNAADVAKNAFLRSFKLPETQKTRFIGEENPIGNLKEILDSGQNVSEILGEKWIAKLDYQAANAWGEYLKTAEKLTHNVNKAFNIYLHTRPKKANGSVGESPMDYMVRTGKLLNEGEQGLLINLAEPSTNKSGEPSYKLSKEILETASIAAIHWLLNSAENSPIFDAEKAAKALGIAEANITPEMMEYVNSGVLVRNGIQEIAAKIRSYMGVTPTADGYIGDQQGIYESLAREMISGMIDEGLVTFVDSKDVSRHTFMEDADGAYDAENSITLPSKIIYKTPYLPNVKNTEDKIALLKGTASVIEELYLLEPEDVRYIGKGAIPKSSTHQLRNPLAPLTRQQKKALDTAQNAEYKPDLTQVGLYGLMGTTGMIALFNQDADIDAQFNKNHQSSVLGQNKGILGAFTELSDVLEGIKAAAKADNTEVVDTGIRYKYEFSGVNRMQMQGRFSPQSSKYLREVLLPTWSSLDLSGKNQQDKANFDTAIAQGLGISIHKLTEEAAMEKLAALKIALRPAMDKVSDLLSMVKEDSLLDQADMDLEDIRVLKSLIQEAGIKNITPLVLHNITELVRVEKADLSKPFRTSIYLEADGMTNGPANAMMMLSGGKVGVNWLNNMERAGFYINQPDASANNKNGNGLQDLYQTTATVFKGFIDSKFRENPKAIRNPSFQLFNMFSPDFSIKDGTAEVGRNFIKNPLTVMIYGSGVNGVGNKLSSTVVDAIYERMSAALLSMSEDSTMSVADALFPNSAFASKELSNFIWSMGAVTGNEYVATGLKADPMKFMREFTLSGKEREAFGQAVTFNIAKPMFAAITNTVGLTVIQNAQNMRKAVGFMSVYASAIQEMLIDKAVEENSKNPDYKKRQLLTNKQMRDIEKEVSRLSATFGSETQNFHIAGDKEYQFGAVNPKTGKKAGIRTSVGLTRKLEMEGTVAGMGNAGVKAIAYMNISVDGQMMQNGLSTKSNIGNSQLPVFDGMNTPANRIQEAGQQMNQAVWDSWMDNSIRTVLERFSEFNKDMDLSKLSVETIAELEETLYEKDDEESEGKPLTERVELLLGKLTVAADGHDALMEVLADMNTVIDQMAGTGNPLKRVSKDTFNSTDPKEIVLEIADRVRKVSVAKEISKKSLRDYLASNKTTSVDGVTVLTASDLKALSTSSGIPADQQSIFKEAVSNNLLSGWTVLAGNSKDVKAFVQKRNGSTTAFNQAVESQFSGFIDTQNKLIVVMNGSSETLAHELIHAGTFAKVDTYYKDPKSLSKEDFEAVQRIEVLAADFTNFDVSTLEHLPGTQAAVVQLQSVMNDAYLQDSPAVAINEYMAWTLTNRELANQAKATKASKLGKVLKDAWAALKALFGKGYLPQAGNDVYSNLRFNSAVLSSNIGSVSELAATSTVLAHNTYGADPRLNAINDTFDQIITSVLDDRKVSDKDVNKSTKLSDELQYAIKVAGGMQAAFFGSSPQQHRTMENILVALASEAQIAPQALLEAQRLFAHVSNHLTVESFMEDVTDDQDRYYAQAKYNAVMGKTVRESDKAGRSSILPAFIALSMVNDEFRKVLQSLPMPKNSESTKEGVDKMLENIGYKGIESLGARFTGVNKATDVLSAMDILSNVIAESIVEKENYAEMFLNRTGGVADASNAFLVKQMEALSDKLMPNRTPEQIAARTKVQELSDSIRGGLALVISEEKGQLVAQKVSTQLDKTELKAWFRDLMGDFIGRTEGNKNIWDMVKGFRSKIQVIRQDYRDKLPPIIRGKFTKPLSKEQWSSLHRSVGKTELASLLNAGMDMDTVLELATNVKSRDAAILNLESEIQNNKYLEKGNADVMIASAKQLAHFMNTGEAKQSLIRNAYAITRVHADRLAGERLSLEKKIDQLVTLYAIDGLKDTDKASLYEIAGSEKVGVAFTLSYLQGQLDEERSDLSPQARMNAYKGYMPFETDGDSSLQVRDDSEHAELVGQGYVRVEAFTGSKYSRLKNKSYYYLPRAARGVFKQGIIQNVKQTKGGVDPATGFTEGTIIHRIVIPSEVRMANRGVGRETTEAPLLPVYDERGDVVAYEQGIAPRMQEMVAAEADLASAIGKWRGRQVEEYLGKISNQELVGKLRDTYEMDIAADAKNEGKYENLYKSKDPVIKDAIRLIPRDTRMAIEAAFGKGAFMVQRGMVKDVVGYRDATVGDLWTGNTRLNPTAQKFIKNAAISIMGNKAFVQLTGAEKIIENLAINAKVLIAVKSGIVPAINIISNLLHLVSRGVPVASIYRGTKELTYEIHKYSESRNEYMAIEAELRATTDPRIISKLEAQMQAIDDSHRRLTIWPLIKAGEFSSVSDADSRYSDVKLTSGKLSEYIEGAVEKLPKGANIAGRYLLVSKETALFNALQKSVEYGDFVAKAILYKDLVGRQKYSEEAALGVITEEFISYDHLPGRARGKLENLGLLWFYNFKLRSTKVALSTIRRNPLHTLLALAIPAPTIFGNPGIPVQDSIVNKVFEGNLGQSMGFGQGLNSIGLNPWVNAAN